MYCVLFVFLHEKVFVLAHEGTQFLIFPMAMGFLVFQFGVFDFSQILGFLVFTREGLTDSGSRRTLIREGVVLHPKRSYGRATREAHSLSEVAMHYPIADRTHHAHIAMTAIIWK